MNYTGLALAMFLVPGAYLLAVALEAALRYLERRWAR